MLIIQYGGLALGVAKDVIATWTLFLIFFKCLFLGMF